jgi:hypothetical protein
MSRFIRAAILGIALSALPACAALAGKAQTEQTPVSDDQQAYLLIGSYALVLEEAARFVRDPRTPKAVKTALGKAEAVATPSVELVKVTAIAYRQARDGETQAALTRAMADAQAPIGALSALVAKQK